MTTSTKALMTGTRSRPSENKSTLVAPLLIGVASALVDSQQSQFMALSDGIVESKPIQWDCGGVLPSRKDYSIMNVNCPGLKLTHDKL